MGSLRIELEGIERNIKRTENRMAEIHCDWSRGGGICCPSCYSEEYRLGEKPLTNSSVYFHS